MNHGRNAGKSKSSSKSPGPRKYPRLQLQATAPSVVHPRVGPSPNRSSNTVKLILKEDTAPKVSSSFDQHGSAPSLLAFPPRPPSPAAAPLNAPFDFQHDDLIASIDPSEEAWLQYIEAAATTNLFDHLHEEVRGASTKKNVYMAPHGLSESSCAPTLIMPTEVTFDGVLSAAGPDRKDVDHSSRLEGTGRHRERGGHSDAAQVDAAGTSQSSRTDPTLSLPFESIASWPNR